MGLGVPPSYRSGDGSGSDGFRPVGEVSPVESATRDELMSFLADGVREGRFNADDARSRVHPRDMRTFDAALAGA